MPQAIIASENFVELCEPILLCLYIIDRTFIELSMIDNSSFYFHYFIRLNKHQYKMNIFYNAKRDLQKEIEKEKDKNKISSFRFQYHDSEKKSGIKLYSLRFYF